MIEAWLKTVLGVCGWSLGLETEVSDWDRRLETGIWDRDWRLWLKSVNLEDFDRRLRLETAPSYPFFLLRIAEPTRAARCLCSAPLGDFFSSSGGVDGGGTVPMTGGSTVQALDLS